MQPPIAAKQHLAISERIGSQLIVRRWGGHEGVPIMTKAYTVKTRNFEYTAAKPTLEAALNVAREKVWPIAPDEKVQVFCGEELVGEIERVF